ncbi:hypothetical protein BDV33DRAFT_204828 [Aspergillus novoparasiticus]|uniref:Uncharacterized protein n=1 Tax=Aspergillus novoparasiticus TaxID=986946 RepID=A0A5N6EMV9_9EURO|nr:hypothetical protein BDV33DRAFT_204828 [Aspergillus novoparasiticus]
MPKISITQDELTDDCMLKAVLLDNEGNEHESELFLDDYPVVNDHRQPYLEFRE